MGSAGVLGQQRGGIVLLDAQKGGVHGTVCAAKKHARKDIIRYIGRFDDSRRWHSALGYRRPNEVRYHYEQTASTG
jgi:hypothetical protein